MDAEKINHHWINIWWKEIYEIRGEIRLSVVLWEEVLKSLSGKGLKHPKGQHN